MELYRMFAQVLEYPTPSLPDQVDKGISLLAFAHREATPMMDEFRAFLQDTSLESMEELYARTFDLQAVCHPYVGYHLFGDGSRRSFFMSGLKGHFKTSGFSSGNELPDHLSTMLRFASNCTTPEREELVRECIMPAVERMVSGFEDDGNPYKSVLEALLLFLQKEVTGRINPDVESEGFCNGR